MSTFTLVWLQILIVGILSTVGGVFVQIVVPGWIGDFLLFFGGLMIGASSMTLVISRTLWGSW